jgi:hypothetical protein
MGVLAFVVLGMVAGLLYGFMQRRKAHISMKDVNDKKRKCLVLLGSGARARIIDLSQVDTLLKCFAF